MMISPRSYANNIRNLPYEELVNERNRISQVLNKFENDELTDAERARNPSPEVVYQCNNLYLIEVTKLLNDRFNESLWNENE